MHWGVIDITNEFIWAGIRGGLISIIMLCAVIYVAFSSVGTGLRAAVGDRRKELLIWSVGCVIFINLAVFMTLAYFGQVIVVWYLSLAFAAVCGLPSNFASPIVKRKPVQKQQSARALALSQQGLHAQA